jgi:hypothetical protein
VTAKYRLLLDEMISGQIAAQLRAKDHDVVAVVDDPELVGTPDEELLIHSAEHGRCLVTANVRDFVPVSASWSSQRRTHAGLIYIVNRVFPSDRSFIGSVVLALAHAIDSGQVPSDGTEIFLRRRAPSGSK